MKSIKNLFLVAVLLALTSCVSKAKFPVSDVVPAAEIQAKKKHDKNNNYAIEITAKNLASPDRLNPPKNNYSIWIVTDKNEYKNIGQLITKKAKTINFKTITPYIVKEIFITAEDEGNKSYPSGLEISRTTFSR